MMTREAQVGSEDFKPVNSPQREAGITNFIAAARRLLAWHLSPDDGTGPTWKDLSVMLTDMEADFVDLVGSPGYPVSGGEGASLTQAQFDERRMNMQRRMASTIWTADPDLAAMIVDALVKLTIQRPPALDKVESRWAFIDELQRRDRKLLDPKFHSPAERLAERRARSAAAGRANRWVTDEGDRKIIREAFFRHQSTFGTRNKTTARAIAKWMMWGTKDQNHLGLKNSYPHASAEVVLRVLELKR